MVVNERSWSDSAATDLCRPAWDAAPPLSRLGDNVPPSQHKALRATLGEMPKATPSRDPIGVGGHRASVSATMSTMLLALALALAALAAPPAHSATPPSHAGGPVIAAGGNVMPRGLRRRALELAKGDASRVVVLNQAIGSRKVGLREVEAWKAAGARHVQLVASLSPRSQKRILGADVIWFTGGDQRRLMKALLTSGADALIHRRHRAGAVVGGFSAGAAVMSRIMLAAGKPRTRGLRRGLITPLVGLGLIPGVIIDQHYVEFGRQARLTSMVLENPKLLGVGISERTAIIVTGRRLEVVGSRVVHLIDARQATVSPAKQGEAQAANGVRLDILRAPMKRTLPGP